MYVPRKALQCPDETRKRSGEKRAKEGKQKESGEQALKQTLILGIYDLI